MMGAWMVAAMGLWYDSRHLVSGSQVWLNNERDKGPIHVGGRIEPISGKWWNLLYIAHSCSACTMYCTTTALDGYPLHSDKIHYTWIVASLYMWNSLLWSTASLLPFVIIYSCHNLLPSNFCFCLSQSTCGPHHQLISTRPAIYMCHDLDPILQFLSLWR